MVARRLQSEPTLEGTLQAIVEAAVDTVPGAGYAAISQVRRRREVYTPVATDELVLRVDQAQYDTGEGPCLDSLFEHYTVRLPTVSDEPRWPTFSARAADLGIGSMVSFQLYVNGDDLGALNLYASEPKAFTDESEQAGLLFATHAAVAMGDAQRIEHLTRALGVREVIGQARGILMERHKLTADQAFTVLVHVSQRTNVKMAEIARHLTETGELLG
ncbi:GAF and ANTAR domain-containing protein [Cryptosporangium japonicum]|uniref:GAF and ANTAR domain-containing protein n=1 Tax=Cryptosporangium japonicum TaxID=80872 RepID=UPI0031CEF51D